MKVSDDRKQAEMTGAEAEIARLRGRCDHLERFKAYVHGRLDSAGVPADPESSHKAEGCRIGGRLDLVLARWVGPPSPATHGEGPSGGSASGIYARPDGDRKADAPGLHEHA